MLATTQWPLERAAHLTSLAWFCVLWLPESLMDLSTLCLFRRRSKKTLKLRLTGLCEGNSPGTGEFPAQLASNAENICNWWLHHVDYYSLPKIRLYVYFFATWMCRTMLRTKKMAKYWTPIKMWWRYADQSQATQTNVYICWNQHIYIYIYVYIYV